MDWGLGIGVVMSRHCIVEDWPEALIRVFMRFNDQIHTVLEKQWFEAADDTNRKTRLDCLVELNASAVQRNN